MIFKQIPVGPMQNFAYIIGDEDTKDAAVVDPGFEAEKIKEVADKEGLTIKHILLTHTHPDHIGDLALMKELTNAKVYVHKSEAEAAGEAQEIDEGDKVKIGYLTVEVMHTPGHTLGGLTFKVENKLITGDILFVEGCGRTDLPGGNTTQMYETLQRVKTWDDDLEVYPGHDYGSKPHSTIKHEKAHNRFLLAKDKDDFFGERLG